MKNLGHLSLTAAPLAVALSLVLFSGRTYAAGPAGGGSVGGANGAVGGPAAAGHSGGAVSGAGRGGVSTGPAVSGARPGVAFSNNGAGQHLGGGNGAFARGGSFRGAGTAPSGLTLPYRNVPNNFAAPSGATARATNAPTGSRLANSWSGTAVAPSNNAHPATARNSARPSNRANNWTDRGFTGQRLSAGAPGANLPTYNQGNDGSRGGNRNGNGRYRFAGRYAYYPYAYGPYYAPYVSYFSGYYAGAYPYYNDVPFADTSYENSPAATVSPQYVEQAPANNDGNQPDAAQPPLQPAPQRQQTPDASNGGTIPGNGPDSLVEAVQDELVRRGYYGGKVDAMFSPDTKEALRKFQADHHLATTGLINEATLHALQLD